MTRVSCSDDPRLSQALCIGLVFVIGVFVPIAFIATLLLGMTLIAVRFVSNRAVGTLGIIIAGIGVLGEVYQLAVQIAT